MRAFCLIGAIFCILVVEISSNGEVKRLLGKIKRKKSTSIHGPPTFIVPVFAEKDGIGFYTKVRIGQIPHEKGKLIKASLKPKELNIYLDTGVAKTWVPAGSRATSYGFSATPTTTDLATPFWSRLSSDGMEYVEGDVMSDFFALTNGRNELIMSKPMVFGSVTVAKRVKLRPNWYDRIRTDKKPYHSDGVQSLESAPSKGALGLGTRLTHKDQTTNFMQEVMNEGLMPKPVFTMFLTKCRKSDARSCPGGRMTIGGEDEKTCMIEGQRRIPTTQQGGGGWTFAIDEFHFEVKTSGRKTPRRRQSTIMSEKAFVEPTEELKPAAAISGNGTELLGRARRKRSPSSPASMEFHNSFVATLDSGIPDMRVPPAIYAMMIEQLQYHNLIVTMREPYIYVRCDAAFDVQFTADGKKYTVTEADMVFEVHDQKTRSVACEIRLQQFNEFVFGIPVYLAYCHIYDVSKWEFTLAPHRVYDRKPKIGDKLKKWL